MLVWLCENPDVIEVHSHDPKQYALDMKVEFLL